ncbi:ATP-binding protein [Clostridium estertheticum]
MLTSQKKTMEEFDFEFQKSITQKQINRLMEMEWIDRMYILRPTGRWEV